MQVSYLPPNESDFSHLPGGMVGRGRRPLLRSGGASAFGPGRACFRATAATPAIVLTGAFLLGGYAFMLLGSLKTGQLFGLLTSISIIGATFGELVIFPLVLARFDREPR